MNYSPRTRGKKPSQKNVLAALKILAKFWAKLQNLLEHDKVNRKSANLSPSNTKYLLPKAQNKPKKNQMMIKVQVRYFHLFTENLLGADK